MVPYVFIIYFLLLLASVVYGLYRYRWLIPAQKIILLVILLTLSVEVLNFKLMLHSQHNLWTTHIFTPLESILLVLAFNSEHQLGVKYKLLLIGGSVLFAVANALWLQPFYTHINSYSSILECLILISLMLKYLQLILLRDNLHSIVKFPLFIVLVSFSIYYLYQICYSGLYNLNLYKIIDLPKIYNHLHFFLNYALYAAILFSFSTHESLNLNNDK